MHLMTDRAPYDINDLDLEPEERLALAVLLRAMGDWRDWAVQGCTPPHHEWPWPHWTAESELRAFFESEWFEELCRGLNIAPEIVLDLLNSMSSASKNPFLTVLPIS
jgi:hypothetical protein